MCEFNDITSKSQKKKNDSLPSFSRQYTISDERKEQNKEKNQKEE